MYRYIIYITIWNGIKRFRPRQDFFFWKITHFALVEFASKVSTKNQMLLKREIWQSLWTLSWRTRTIMTMAISTTPSLWPLSSTPQSALSMVTVLWVIKDFSRLLLRLVWSWGTGLTTPFSAQNTDGFRCTGTACAASTCLSKNDFSQGNQKLYSTFIRPRLD